MKTSYTLDELKMKYKLFQEDYKNGGDFLEWLEEKEQENVAICPIKVNVKIDAEKVYEGLLKADKNRVCINLKKGKMNIVDRWVP